LPTGKTAMQSGTTGLNGTATWNYALGPHAALGKYSVVATASYNGGTATSAAAAFSVN